MNYRAFIISMFYYNNTKCFSIISVKLLNENVSTCWPKPIRSYTPSPFSFKISIIALADKQTQIPSSLPLVIIPTILLPIRKGLPLLVLLLLILHAYYFPTRSFITIPFSSERTMPRVTSAVSINKGLRGLSKTHKLSNSAPSSGT